MRIICNYIKVFSAIVGGCVGWFFGEANGLIYTLLAFVIVDYLSGVMCGVLDKKLSSEIGAKGIFKKVLIFMLVGIANVIDNEIIGAGSAIRNIVIFFYISNEGISILENASKIGLPIPEKLKTVFLQINKDKNNNADTNEDTNDIV